MSVSHEPAELSTGSSVDEPGLQAQRGPRAQKEWEGNLKLIKSKNLGFVKEAL